MTDDLIERLRDDYQKTVALCAEAADALEIQARRISELESMIAVHRLAVDVDALKARIAELEAESVAFNAISKDMSKYTQHIIKLEQALHGMIDMSLGRAEHDDITMIRAARAALEKKA